MDAGTDDAEFLKDTGFCLFCGAHPHSWRPSHSSTHCWGDHEGLQRWSSKSRITMLVFGLVPSPLPLSQPQNILLLAGKTDHRNDVMRRTWEFCQALFGLPFNLLLIQNCMLIQQSDFFPPVHTVAGSPWFFLLLFLFVCLMAHSMYHPWPMLKSKVSASEYWQKDCLWWVAFKWLSHRIHLSKDEKRHQELPLQTPRNHTKWG